jgi:hypothetical protein
VPTLSVPPDLALSQGLAEVDIQGLGAGFLERPEGIKVPETGPVVERREVGALARRVGQSGDGHRIPLPDMFKIYPHFEPRSGDGQCGITVTVRQADGQSGRRRDAVSQGPANHPVEPTSLAALASPPCLIFATLVGRIEQGLCGRCSQPDRNGVGGVREIDRGHGCKYRHSGYES